MSIFVGGQLTATNPTAGRKLSFFLLRIFFFFFIVFFIFWNHISLILRIAINFELIARQYVLVAIWRQQTLLLVESFLSFYDIFFLFLFYCIFHILKPYFSDSANCISFWVNCASIYFGWTAANLATGQQLSFYFIMYFSCSSNFISIYFGCHLTAANLATGQQLSTYSSYHWWWKYLYHQVFWHIICNRVKALICKYFRQFQPFRYKRLR